VKELLQGKHFKISMGKAYVLKIVAIEKPSSVEVIL
jgi:hypothetical protein